MPLQSSLNFKLHTTLVWATKANMQSVIRTIDGFLAPPSNSVYD